MTPEQPIRTLIVDDEPLARDAIRLLLRDDCDIEIAGECRDGQSAVDALRAGNIDLIFLDVQMPGMTGFDVVREIGPEKMPLIIFATAFDEYAIQAFEAEALDYLLKPIDDARFERSLNRAKRLLSQSTEVKLVQRLSRALEVLETNAAATRPELRTKLALKTSTRVVLVDPSEIDWIEAADYCLRVHVGTTAHLLRESMQTMQQRLDDTMFVRIHRSSIVNVDRIREIQPLFHGDYVVILIDGTKLRVSRSRRHALEARLGRRF
ncbi:MAG: LytTR family DNA-binding domain-containing protein [Phycisphaerales bacterium]